MPTKEPQAIVIAGASGEVGRQLVRLASTCVDVTVYALTRRVGVFKDNPAVCEILFNFEDPGAYDALFEKIPCHVLFLALGSTLKQAGRAGVLRVERDYPIALIDALAKHRPMARIGFVSSVGADSPVGYYLKAKADVEAHIMNSNLGCAIARPSLLLGQRTGFRTAEMLIHKTVARPWIWALQRVAPRSQRAWRWAPVKVEDVAATLFHSTLELSDKQNIILEGLDLRMDGLLSRVSQ